MRHIINLEVENHSGVLARIAGLFSARAFNIESLTVNKAESAETSRITIVVRGDDWIIEQVTKQLNKLIDVIKVTDVTQNDYVARELIMVKVSAPQTKRIEINQVIEIFRAKVVDISHKTMTMELTGSEPKINAFLETLKPFGIKEVHRTGAIAMIREFNMQL